eukprot:11606589-Alexandrium_andersonii.AAC.1
MRTRKIWQLAREYPRIAWVADWGIADWSLLPCNFAPSDPLNPRFRRRIQSLHETWRRTHPSGASRTNFQAALGPAQFQ